MVCPESERLAERLAALGWRIVFAESCTAGLGSARLAAVPGISEWLCGSWVTYRDECKQAWLGVPADLLREKSAVSREVTAWMAVESLRRTPSAHLSAAVTGHLGPASPPDGDGRCYLAAACRQDEQVQLLGERSVELDALRRTDRQDEAARRLLAFCAELLTDLPDAFPLA
jgi:PncC family amidohydrolase